MTIMQYILVYLITVPVFFIIDLLWLGVVAKNFYRNQLAELLGPVNWPAAVTFYLIFIVGIVTFAIVPALNATSLQKALIFGALFGFFTYATYDLTNLATLKDWPMTVVVVEIIWGTVLSGSVTTVGYWLAKQFIL